MSQKNAEKKSSGGGMRQFYMVVGVVAVIGVLAIGFSAFQGGGARGVASPVDLGGLEGRALADAAEGVRVGNEDAPIIIMEFGDYQCPSCAQFASLVKPAIMRDLVATGRVAFEFYDFPLTDIHPNAFLAARAGRCAADQDQFWTYHDNLFGAQTNWAAQADPSGTFVDIAGSVGLDEGAFRECLGGDAHAELVTANLLLAQALRLGGTPAIVLQKGGGTFRQLPAFDYRTILAGVEELEGPVEPAATDSGGTGAGG